MNNLLNKPLQQTPDTIKCENLNNLLRVKLPAYDQTIQEAVVGGPEKKITTTEKNLKKNKTKTKNKKSILLRCGS